MSADVITLRVLTTQEPDAATQRRTPCTGYTCKHLECARARQHRHQAGAATCRCARPATYIEGGELRCICGRKARPDARAA